MNPVSRFTFHFSRLRCFPFLPFHASASTLRSNQAYEAKVFLRTVADCPRSESLRRRASFFPERGRGGEGRSLSEPETFFHRAGARAPGLRGRRQGHVPGTHPGRDEGHAQHARPTQRVHGVVEV